ncbi:metallophosphoesterase [Helicovermis profundi]|uniref:Metallophosphoesterase n=1 Tax=Helicovermis profundi TaxID=3065157 RepID=A0AAU9EC24_9FIRM|nr:metallophosphoesterase [Clostridia bacterium S502]
MALYAIGDLHLSFSESKPMDIFGENWNDYENKIKKNWLEKISDEDTILIPGDISWAIKFSGAMIDLEWIDKLPGKKIIIKGNHDYWWTSLKKMIGKFETIDFLHNKYFVYKDYAICGSRGWNSPSKTNFTESDLKIYKREIIRLKISLDSAIKDGYSKFIVMMHYPPTNDLKETSEFTSLFEKYGVEKVIYGHLHTEASFFSSIQGDVNGVEYILVSSDYLKFDPKKVL